MSDIKPLIDSLRSMELPKGADSILSNILEQHKTIVADRDDLKTKVDERQDENADLRGKLQDAKNGKLSEADQIRWAAYQALGKVDEVKEKLDRVDELEAKNTKRERDDGLKEQGFKPSIFELIAEGKSYRVDGEGDDRKVYLSVDDKEVELTTYASERGLDDLLGVMGLEAGESSPKPRTPTGAGNKTPKGFKALPASERAKEKDKESRYSGM